MSDAGSDHAPLRQLPADRSVNICGKNGVAYIVRPISPKDAPSLMRGYDAMSDQAKWFRMHAPRFFRRARDAHDILKHDEILCQINQRLDEGICRLRGLPGPRRFIAAIMMLLQTVFSSALMV